MIEIKHCPICGSGEFNTVRNGYYFRGKRETFTVQECKHCKLWLTNPRPHEDDLGSYYDTEDYVSHTDGKRGALDLIYNAVRDYAVKSKLSLLSKYVSKGAILDYGAGTGVFLQKAKEQGWKTQGIEMSKLARTNAASRGLELKEPSYLKEIPKNSLQAITLWHVLEHLDDPLVWTKRLASKLAPGGVLVYALPNHESWDSEIYNDDWAALDLPLHLFHFKKSNLKDLAEACNLSLDGVHNMPFDAFYVSMLSEKNKGGSTLTAFLNGMKSNLKGRASKNQSSLIYVLRKPKL